MKNVIDCDDVFEILTQAPFPTGGSSDEDVETHLRVCHDCRCLAEALRPAVGLFHESLANEESLPQYDGQLLAPRPGGSVGSRQKSHFGALLAAGLAASLLTCLSFTGGFRGAGKSPGHSHQVISAVPDAEGFITLCALQLPKSCRARDERQATPLLVAEVATKPVANGEDLDFSCCTQCHQRGGVGPASARALHAFGVACAACHRPEGTSTAVNLRLRWPPLVKNVG